MICTDYKETEYDYTLYLPGEYNKRMATTNSNLVVGFDPATDEDMCAQSVTEPGGFNLMVVGKIKYKSGDVIDVHMDDRSFYPYKAEILDWCSCVLGDITDDVADLHGFQNKKVIQEYVRRHRDNPDINIKTELTLLRLKIIEVTV